MSRRWFSSSAAALALAAALAWAAWDLARPRRLNVIVLTIESARAADITPETLPKLFQAARSGTRFARHRAVSAWTAPNIVAILAGLSPFDQGVHARGQAVAADARLPLERLAAEGWRVAGLQAFMAESVFDNLGLRIEAGRDLAPWLAASALSRRPFFVWYHYLDTHLPYAPAEAYRPDIAALLKPNDAAARARLETVMTKPVIPAGSIAFQDGDRAAIRALYLANLRAFDDWFATVWAFLGSAGLLDDTIVVLSADHGEEHLERGLVGHASTTRAAQLHEEIVRVPLVVWVPKRLASRLAPGERSDETAHTDIMPAILSLLGRGGAGGRGLLDPAPEERAWNAVTSRAGFAEPDPEHVTHFVLARKEGPWKLILETDGDAPVRRQLFDLESDPGERRDRAAEEGARADRMAAVLVALKAAMRPPTKAEIKAESSAQAPAERPRWIFPAASGAIGYDDFAGRFRLEWTGSAAGGYVIQYRAGTGPSALAGEIQLEGAVKDFGKIERGYWNKFVVPFSPFRVRVRPGGRDDLWSEWMELEARPAP